MVVFCIIFQVWLRQEPTLHTWLAINFQCIVISLRPLINHIALSINNCHTRLNLHDFCLSRRYCNLSILRWNKIKQLAKRLVVLNKSFQYPPLLNVCQWLNTFLLIRYLTITKLTLPSTFLISNHLIHWWLERLNKSFAQVSLVNSLLKQLNLPLLGNVLLLYVLQLFLEPFNLLLLFLQVFFKILLDWVRKLVWIIVTLQYTLFYVVL